MSGVDKDTSTKPQKQNNPYEIHPRAQAKLDELQRRGFIGKQHEKPVIQPQPQPQPQPEPEKSEQ